jgi:hypothetical protein
MTAESRAKQTMIGKPQGSAVDASNFDVLLCVSPIHRQATKV